MSGDNEELLLKKLYNHLSNGHVGGLPDNIYVIDTAGNRIPLKTVIGDNKKLVFKFSETNCSTCIAIAMGRLNELGNTIGAGNIIFIASFSGQNDLRIFNQVNNVKFNTYTLPAEFNRFFTAADKMGVPYLFMLDNLLNSRMVFFTDKADNPAQRLFYGMIKDEFEQKATHVPLFSATEYDFKKIRIGTTQECVFNFRNTTGSTISIRNVEYSCECTKATWEKAVSVPNEWSSIKVSFEAREPGVFIRTIKVYFDNGDPAELKIKGEVIK